MNCIASLLAHIIGILIFTLTSYGDAPEGTNNVIIHNDMSSRRPFIQGASEEPVEQTFSAVSRHHSEQHRMMGWIGLMSLCIEMVPGIRTSL